MNSIMKTSISGNKDTLRYAFLLMNKRKTLNEVVKYPLTKYNISHIVYLYNGMVQLSSKILALWVFLKDYTIVKIWARMMEVEMGKRMWRE